MRRRLGAAAGLAALALAGCRVRIPFADELFFRSASTALPSAGDCERCHLEVYDEWSSSLHARAWTSDAFQTASLSGRASQCVGCHAPEPFSAQGSIELRDAHREEGVTCASCHLAPGPEAAPLTMRGPVSRSSPVEVHPIFEEDPFYRSSELCGRCHRGAFEEWEASARATTEEPETCQGCHMPEIKRTVESYHPDHPYSAVFVALERKETLRRHLFAVPEDSDRYVELHVAKDGPEQLRIVVRNELPHALPTGRFGRRVLRVVAEWEGGRAETELVRALGEAIPAGEERELNLAVPVRARRARVRLERWDHGKRAWTRLAEVPIGGAAPPSPEASLH